MAALDNRALNYCEARFRSGLQLGIKLAFLHVPFWFGDQQGCARLADVRDLGEERGGIRKFVYDRKGKSELHAIAKICEAHGIGQGQSRIDPAIELQFGESTLQLVNHLRLHIDANDAARCAN